MEKKYVYDTEVLIIGAGLSGLTAAKELHSRGFDILVLESQDHVGGRTLSAHLTTVEEKIDGENDARSREEKLFEEPFETEEMGINVGDLRIVSDYDAVIKPFDLGGQWITPSQSHIIELLKQLEIETHSHVNDNLRLGIDLDVFDPDGSETFSNDYKIGVPGLHPFRGILPRLTGFLELVEMDSFVQKVEKLCKTTVLGQEWRKSFKKLEGLSVGDLIRSKVSRPLTKKILLAVIETIHGADPDQISAPYFLAHTNAGGGFLPKCRAALHGHERRSIKGGAQSVSHALQSLIGAEKVIFHATVTSVTETEKRVLIETSSSDRFSAKSVIIAVPPRELLNIEFSPPLSDDRLSVLHQLLPAKSCKFVVTYTEAFWMELGFSGDIITYGTGREGYERFYDKNPEHEQLAVTFYVFDSSSESHGAALTGILSSEICDYWSRKEPSDRKSAVLNGLAQIFGHRALYPIDYAEKFWTGELYSASCSTYLAAIGSMRNYSILAEGHGRRVYFAGSETATSWPGYMNGAVQAGERAACEVLYSLSPNALSASEIHEYILKRKARASHPQRELSVEEHLIIAKSESEVSNDVREIDDNDFRLPKALQFLSNIEKKHIAFILTATVLYHVWKRYKLVYHK